MPVTTVLASGLDELLDLAAGAPGAPRPPIQRLGLSAPMLGSKEAL
jgi:hypothetical protein